MVANSLLHIHFIGEAEIASSLLDLMRTCDKFKLIAFSSSMEPIDEADICSDGYARIEHIIQCDFEHFVLYDSDFRVFYRSQSKLAAQQEASVILSTKYGLTERQATCSIYYTEGLAKVNELLSAELDYWHIQASLRRANYKLAAFKPKSIILL